MTIRLLVSTLLLLAGQTLLAQGSAASGNLCTGNLTGQGKAQTLSMKGGELFFAEPGAVPAPAGDLRPYRIGEGGVNCFNVDANREDRLSLVFFDAGSDFWYVGRVGENHLVTFESLRERDGLYTPLQVGSGVQMFPREQAKAAAAESKAAVSSATAMPLTYPVVGQQYTRLAASQQLWTSFIILPDGTVLATTKCEESTLLDGFHGQAKIGFYLTPDTTVPQDAISGVSVGCTGKMWGAPISQASWTAHIPPQDLPFLHFYAVVQVWQPNWSTVANDTSKFAALAASVVQILSKL